MNRARIQRLADHLRTVAPVRFDMAAWGTGLWRRHSCGSAGCMIGHAVEIPEFAEAGLELVDPEPVGPGFPEPKFKDAFNYGALAAFFDISAEDAGRLFSAESEVEEDETEEDENGDPVLHAEHRYWTPTQAAEVLERYLATGELPQ